MTRTGIYHATPNHIVEQPAMEPPYYYDAWLVCKKINKFLLLTSDQIKPIEEYNAHLSTLRTIPAHDSARSLWKDGQKVEEGKDYELKSAWARNTDRSYPTKDDLDLLAFPIPIVIENNDALWDEMFCYYFDQKLNGVVTSQIVRNLRQKYIITKR